ncbi:alpha-tocopherol transfer protein-like [Tubulanus polymorphus]|uniref:alpha-tocopherol transfer protein-like n=1 Tax=Tubulanus polymorphus TaxID=672921 RepID=UPI003DA2ED3A
MATTYAPYICTLDDAALAKAKKELNEVPKEREGQIAKLRELILKKPGITCRTDAKFLIRFLRRSKFSVIAAQKMIENFVIVRASEKHGIPKWFHGVSPYSEDMMEIMDTLYTTPLPGRDKNGEKILLIRTGAWDPKRPEMFENLFRYGLMVTDICLRDEATQVHGFTIICDFEGFSASHASYWTYTIVKNAMNCWQDTYPNRNKGVHYYKAPRIFDAVYFMMSGFMKEKLKKRIHFHKSLDELTNAVNRKSLPNEYGGVAGPLKEINQNWKLELCKNKDELDLLKILEVNDNEISSDWSKTNVSDQDKDMSGVAGSFRKLNTD